MSLMARDCLVLRETLGSDIIDAVILLSLQYVNYVYFLPLLGMPSAFISMLFVGSVGSFFINSAFDRGIEDSADVAFTHFIQYQKTLPISLSWLFAQKIVMHMLSMAIVSIPAVSLLFWYVYANVTFVGLLWFLFLYMCTLLWIAALIIAIAFGTHFFWFIDNVWTRVLMPILMFGCHYFPWKAAYDVSPWIGALFALSPLTYMAEGMRSALIGGDQFLPVTLCSVVLVLVTIVTVVCARILFFRRLYA